MKSYFYSGLVCVAFGLGCGAMNASESAKPNSDASATIRYGGATRTGGTMASFGGSMASGGAQGQTRDAGTGSVPRSDASPSGDAQISGDGKLPTSLGVDALVFRRDGGPTGTGGGSPISDAAVSPMGGSMGTGGSMSGAGGAPSSTGTGGTLSMGGMAATGGKTTGAGGTSSPGGAMAGGATQAGGTTAQDAGSSDAWRPLDAPSFGGAIPAQDAGQPVDARTGDATTSADGGGACVVRILGVVPTSLDKLIAGADRTVVLRADAGDGKERRWSWWSTFAGVQGFPSAVGQIDAALAKFSFANAGTYTVSVVDNSEQCHGSISFEVLPSNACLECNRTAIVRVAPPVAKGIPVQSGAVTLRGLPPFSQNTLVLNQGVEVRIGPSRGPNAVDSYVRVLDMRGTTLSDGVADQRSPFIMRLLPVNTIGEILRYHVLVVPLDGQNGGTLGATAPQLFPNLTPMSINTKVFELTGGTTLLGTITAPTGAGLSDARVVFSNQNPDGVSTGPQFLFSSVGQSNAQGEFRINLQPGSYFPSVTPPKDQGFSEAVALSHVDLTLGTRVSFRFDAVKLSRVKLAILDSLGVPLQGAKVRLSTENPRQVGRFTVMDSDGGESQLPGFGNVVAEIKTSASGEVVFANLPSNTEYRVLLSPEPNTPLATTTSTLIHVPEGEVSKTLRTLAQTTIKGILKAPLGVSSMDFSRVAVWAYDKTPNEAESPRSVMVGIDGGYSLPVTPHRSYVLMAIPPADSPTARTFIGSGPMKATEFEIVQRMAPRMDWASQILDENGSTLGGSAVQVYCHETWPLCVDATLPLAETTAAYDGSFRLSLPNESQ